MAATTTYSNAEPVDERWPLRLNIRIVLWPDPLFDLMIAVIVVRGGIHIIKDANAEMKSMDAGTDSGF